MGWTMSLDMNERAWALASSHIDRAAEFNIAVHTLPGGARVIDAGVNVGGGFAAGRALTALCMGGLGHVEYTTLTIGGEMWPGVLVWTDHPSESCMASQYAGWAITPDGYFAMGSGPLRAKARVEHELFAKLGYEESATRGVLVLESRTLPTAEVAEWVADKAGVCPRRPDVCRGPDREHRRRRADRRARPRDRLAQDGHGRLRRAPRRERHGHGPAPADGAERHAGDRTHERLHPVRRPGALYRSCGR